MSLENSKLIIGNPTKYDKAKYLGYDIREYPIDEKKHRWIIESVDHYEDGTEIITEAYECDVTDLGFIRYSMNC